MLALSYFTGRLSSRSLAVLSADAILMAPYRIVQFAVRGERLCPA